MTRINVGIKPSQLTDEHLRSEYREIQRLPSNYRASVRSGSINRLPKKFTLGKGHVLWCLDKFEYTQDRTIDLYRELGARGYYGKVDYESSPMAEFTGYHSNHFQDYTPTPEDRQLLIDRITERITNSPKKYWHYYGERITPEQAIELLTKDM